MIKQKNYKKTLIACYLGFVTQAISANFVPLLFLTFKSTYGITLEKIAMFMGISRILYGKFSEKLDLAKVMLICGIMCAGCYLLASLSSLPILALAGCGLCGLAVGIMWPGSISISSQKCPRGGTAMFAFLALAGDFGATISPAMVGSLSEIAGGNLKTGLLVATIFPVILVVGLIVLNKDYIIAFPTSK